MYIQIKSNSYFPSVLRQTNWFFGLLMFLCIQGNVFADNIAAGISEYEQGRLNAAITELKKAIERIDGMLKLQGKNIALENELWKGHIYLAMAYEAKLNFENENQIKHIKLAILTVPEKTLGEPYSPKFRELYASIKNQIQEGPVTDNRVVTGTEEPVYKKWWFWTGLAILAGAAASGSSSDDSSGGGPISSGPTGTEPDTVVVTW